MSLTSSASINRKRNYDNENLISLSSFSLDSLFSFSETPKSKDNEVEFDILLQRAKREIDITSSTSDFDRLLKRVKNIDGRDDDDEIPYYPETIESFTRDFTDGIKGDVVELLSSIQKTFQVLIPFGNLSTPNKVKSDQIESINKVSSSNKNDNTFIKHKISLTDETELDLLLNKENENENTKNVKYIKQIYEKDNNNEIVLSDNINKTTPQSQHQVVQQPKSSTRKVKEGGQVQLSKLGDNGTLVSFSIMDDKVIIIGSRRLLLVKKNNAFEGDTTANVLMWLLINSIESAMYRYSDNDIILDLTMKDGKKELFQIPNIETSKSIIKAISEKKEEMINRKDSDVKKNKQPLTKNTTNITKGNQIVNDEDQRVIRMRCSNLWADKAKPVNYNSVELKKPPPSPSLSTLKFIHTPITTQIVSISASSEINSNLTSPKALPLETSSSLTPTSPIRMRCPSTWSDRLSPTTNSFSPLRSPIKSPLMPTLASINTSELLSPSTSPVRIKYPMIHTSSSPSSSSLLLSQQLETISRSPKNNSSKTFVPPTMNNISGNIISGLNNSNCQNQSINSQLKILSDTIVLPNEIFEIKPGMSIQQVFLPVKLEKFQKMINMGISKEAVNVKMNLENISKEQQELVFASKNLETSASKPVEESIALPPLELPIELQKFQKMLKMGIPQEAVSAKMNLENISKEQQELVFASKILETSASKPVEESIALPPLELPIELQKFQKMLKMGIPQEAVSAKMNLENISKEQQHLVLNVILNPKEGEITKKFNSIGPLSKDKEIKIDETVILDENNKLPDHLEKFKKMLKMGVPPGAVAKKMIEENISEEEQKIILEVKNTSTKLVVVKPSSKLLSLHWEPLKHVQGEDSNIEGSIWEGLGDDSILKDGDLGSLADLFGKKESKVFSNKRNNEINDNDIDNEKSKKSKKSAPTLIPSSRGMNISIILSSFRSRSLDIDKIKNIISTLDFQALSLDDCLRIKDILPTIPEIKVIKSPKINIDELHESEFCLLMLSKIPDVANLVQSMIFLNSLSSISEYILTNSKLLLEAFSNILVSIGLKEIIRCVLAIGNAMNQGTYKGDAVGFKLSGLNKLQQTKSTDGKCTLMDYLIQILISRLEAGEPDCQLALDLCIELKSVLSAKSLHLSDLLKDSRAFRTDFELSNSVYKNLVENKDNNSGIEISNDQKKLLKDSFSSAASIISIIDTSIALTNEKGIEMAKFLGEETSESVLATISEFITSFENSKKLYYTKQKSIKRQTDIDARKEKSKN